MAPITRISAATSQTLGSSARPIAAVLISLGFIGPPLGWNFGLELCVQAAREDRDRPAVGVIGRVCDQLIVRGQRDVLVHRIGIVGLKDALLAVVESAVADENTEAAGGQEVAIILRDGIDRAADADDVVRPAPFRALDRQSAGQAAVDVG